MKQYFDIIPPEEENIQPQVEKNEVHIPIKKNMFSAKKEKVQQVTNIKKEKEPVINKLFLHLFHILIF